MLYTNSMIQEKTGVSACEILLGRNPNLPSDISFTPVTSLPNDRKGYVKQLKRDLKDIRQKLSRVLGQNMDQNANPFTVGEKVIIALLPHENASKLMAKWKGPFIVTKVPNRFQIEYLDGNITRLTHICYAKKYNERCHHTEQVGIPRPKRVSKRQPWERMARIRLIAGTGCRKARMAANSVKVIQDNWGVKVVRIRVQVLGEVDDLPAGLKAIVDAAGPELCIEGSVLVDLCMQRSDERGSGCDAPAEISEWPTSSDGVCESSEGLLTPVTPSLRPPKPPRTGKRQFSWRNSPKREICIRMCIFEPLKFRKEKELTFKSQESTINKQSTRKGLKGNKKDQEVESRHIGETNYDVIDDAIISTPDDDTTHRELEVNRLIARKRQKTGEKSLMYSVGGFGRSLMACNRTITFVALLLAIIINVTKGLVNIRPLEGKSIVGNSSSLPLSAPIFSEAFPSSLFLYILRVLAAFIVINAGFCHYMTMKTLRDNNNRLKRRRKVLHNTGM